MDKYLTVTALNRYLKAKFEQDRHLSRVYLKGEVSNLRRQYNGHIYFTIKDAHSKIQAIMFSSYARQLKFELKDGMQVLVFGSVQVYADGGTYSIQVHSIEVDGIGQLYLQIEQTKKKLSQEGLFDQNHKKPIKRYPSTIGVIAPKNSAALEDIIQIISRRYPIARIHVFETPMQAKNAYLDIIQSLHRADSMNLDVLILARGGGDLEELMNFNEEALVRCIYDLHTPIITGVGHEIDYTLVDFVSDLRAPTPSGAAELCSEDLHDTLQTITMKENQLTQLILNRIAQYQIRMKNYERMQIIVRNNYLSQKQKVQLLTHRLSKVAAVSVSNYHNRINQSQTKIQECIKQHLWYQQIRLNHLIEGLQLVSPLNVLKRGYSIIYKDTIVTDIHEIKEDDQITMQMANGKVSAKLKEVKYEE